MKKLTIYHWYGDDKAIEDKTGLQHGKDYVIQDMFVPRERRDRLPLAMFNMIRSCFDAGYNVMLLKGKDTITFCIAKGRFSQR